MIAQREYWVDVGSAQQEYQIDLIRTETAFHALQRDWTWLYEESHPRNPFLSYDWAACCWDHLCQGTELFILTARAGSRLVGVAPLRLERHLGSRVLRFIGKGFSPYAGFLHSPEHPDVEAALLSGLARSRRHWDLLLMTQLADPFTRLHRLPMPAGLRGQVSDSPWKGSSYTALDGDWEELCREGPRWLASMEKKVRRFERCPAVIERHLGVAAVDHIAEISYIEERSWKAQYGQSQSAEARQRVEGLLRQAFTTLGARAEIELWLAHIEGEPVAYEVNFLLPDRLWLYRGAYHDGFAKLSPGAVVDLIAIRQSWQEGRREYDFMSGSEPYKAERTNAVRPLKQLLIYPRTPRGCMAYASLIVPRTVMETCAPARSLLRGWHWLRTCPKALLPGSGIKRSRIH